MEFVLLEGGDQGVYMWNIQRNNKWVESEKSTGVARPFNPPGCEEKQKKKNLREWVAEC